MAEPSLRPVWMDHLWAKSAEKGEGGEPETLAQHTWYVLARLADFIHLRPGLPQAIGTPQLWELLYWAAFLHDFGKAAAGFQARLRGGPKWPDRHEVLSLAFLDWIAGGFRSEEQTWLAAAIVSHHRDAPEIQRKYPEPDDPDEDPLVEKVAEFDLDSLHHLWRWLHECGSTWLTELGLADLGIRIPVLLPEAQAVALVQKKGASRIHDWLKRYRHFVQRLQGRQEQALLIGTLALRGTLINADHSASAHAGALPTVSFDVDQILAAARINPQGLYAHQREAGHTPGSALLVAPTGSGKTEAALLWAAHQASTSSKVPRLFYTLPYQASMNAMERRLREGFGDEKVGLQHGRSLLAIYRLLLEREDDPRQAARQAKWIKNLIELNYPPIRVFSPYQLLKSLYRLTGYEALLTDYHNALFIFDEIHAYEETRLALILKTMEFLAQKFSARFLVMSATFPTLIKQRLAEALSNPLEIRATQALFDEFRRHRLCVLAGELLSPAGIDRIVADALSGKSVLAVCNLVDRAQALYTQLQARLAPAGVPVELLHGRFNIRDRLAKEAIVRTAAGSKSEQRRPIVLVATQVVEVSLDIDLDTLYTDPAPLEALVQRFGRINRRRKQTEALVHVCRQPNDGQKIYDPALVRRTLSILEREHERMIDEGAIGAWLDEIYTGEIADRWQANFSLAASEFEANCLQSLRAFEADPNLEEQFYRAFDSVEVLPISLYDEYRALKEDEPIRAGELLVPISWGRYHALANAGRVLAKDKYEPYIVNAAYRSETGMTFGNELEVED
jgi:CRISPR-associated endonuclease/helicase Cas3